MGSSGEPRGRFVGPYVELAYGTVILAFMSGVLWGFATKAPERQAPVCYALSVIPALWAFFMAGGGPVAAGGGSEAPSRGSAPRDRGSEARARPRQLCAGAVGGARCEITAEVSAEHPLPAPGHWAH